MLKVDSSNFEQEVMQSGDTVTLVDFWAEWCGPCRALGATLDEVEKEMSGSNTKIVKINVDEAGDLAQKFGIRGIPTLMYFKNGQVKTVSTGNQSKEEIVKTLKSHI